MMGPFRWVTDGKYRRRATLIHSASSWVFGNIMCHRVADQTGFANPPLPALGVWPLTAREVGWEDLDGDGTLEIVDACPGDGGC